MPIFKSKSTGNIIEGVGSINKLRTEGIYEFTGIDDPLFNKPMADLKDGDPVWIPVELTEEEKAIRDEAEFNTLKPQKVSEITRNAIQAVKEKYPSELWDLYIMGLVKEEDKARIDLDKQYAMSQAIAKYASIDTITTLAELKSFDTSIEVQ